MIFKPLCLPEFQIVVLSIHTCIAQVFTRRDLQTVLSW